MITPPDAKSGHVGNLTPEQSEKLKQFWTILFELDEMRAKSTHDRKASSKLTAEDMSLVESLLEKYDPKTIKERFWLFIAHDDPDAGVLRFLRARKFDVHLAFKMAFNALQWRMESDVDGVSRLGEAGILEQLRAEHGDKEAAAFTYNLNSGKVFFRGLDRHGRPICHIHVSLHKSSDQTFEQMQKLCIYLMETARLFLQPPNETALVFFDMTDFSLSNMDFNFIKFLITCFEAYYPESLGVCLIHRAPWVFQGVWRIIAPLLDPVVASKIHFTRTDAELLQFIPPEHLPVKFGGTDPRPWTFLEPVPGESAALNDRVGGEAAWKRRREAEAKYEELVREWINGKDIGKDRPAAVEELRKARFELEPFIRAKTVYHREGVLKIKGGECLVNWDYAGEKKGL